MNRPSHNPFFRSGEGMERAVGAGPCHAVLVTACAGPTFSDRMPDHPTAKSCRKRPGAAGEN